MKSATPCLAQTYELYMGSQTLGQALRSDLRERFAHSPISTPIRDSGDRCGGHRGNR
jgi:hypothetical protein